MRRELLTVPGTWGQDDLTRVDAADELHIAAARLDGKPARSLPIWVVTVDGNVYVRTWHRRSTGWYGQALASGRASVAVPGVEAEVVVDDVGAKPAGLRRAIDSAYRSKYARYGESTVGQMVGDEGAATTLRLTPRS